ncbi:hypothetical protein BKA65DRAFT_109754 [Rhexocercosporidium sp. MPI-PUGE-AT-0058]|nr:hypothetical protein BKA65DRAFT_109754 [Rhexocercosporidium sp. MPI-PUGE-AT-0058]
MPIQTSPPSNPKADRRSSWGLPLSMSRSSGRPDTMSRNSRESNPTSTLNRPRTNTMPSERSSPAPQLPAVATGYSLGVMSGALSSEHPETPTETLTIQPIPSTSTSNHTATVEPDSKTGDTLGVPAPIGKHQPTWDPFNATPIAEEDGFQYEERPKPRLSSDPNSIPDGLSGPADNLAKSDRSNSLDVPFFDAREASDDINNDWVMVDPEPEARGSIAGPFVSKLPSSADPAVRQSLDKPTTSILDQSRGSCSQDASPQIPAQTKAEADVSESVDGGPTTSILNRPRGSFSYDTPPSTSPAKPMTSTLTGLLLNNPTPSTQPIERPATPPAPVVSTLPAAVQRTPSPQKSAQVQPEKQSGASSFLPPIRRTSTFGIGFGSRQPKQRFAIEEDDEASPPRVSGFQQQHFAGEISMAMEQPRQESENSRSLAGAAIGAAAVAAITSHEKDRKGDQAMTARDSAVAETQRPFSFHQSSAAPLTYPEQPALTAEAEDLRPSDDTNTCGVRDELVPNMNHPPMPESPGKQRKSSFPPPGFITDPAPFKDHAEGQQSSSEQVFAEEPEELTPRGDTNTWGVGNEMPPSMIQAPLPGISGQQRQASFPPPGFAVDPEAHGPSQIIQPVDVKAPTFKQPLTVDTGASTQSQRQASFPPPGFKVDPQAHGPAEAIRGVSLTDVAPRTPAHARANSNESAPRPLSFQQTPPRESGHQRQPSLPLSFTREPEEIGPRAGNIEEGSLTHGSDSQAHESIPPSFSRDPEKEELAPPQRSPRRISIQASPQQSLPQRDPIKTMFTPPRADNILQRPEFKESQVEWRPNRPRVVTKPSQSSYSSESYGKETGILAARTNSWDTQPPPRAYSGSSSYMQRQDSQFSEKGGWASPQQSKPFEQPPSSAQRYPELFKPGQQQSVVESPRDADLPAHYYQAPISRTQAFLPRQQTNEYQLPGVGPPEEPPVNPSRRNSGFLRDIGGRLSRNSSRERRNSISRDQDRLSPERGLESRGEYAESSVMSEDGQERKKRRASFFGHLSRNSFSGQSPPKSRESIIAHHAGSRTDLLVTPQPSPVKRSFFGGSSSEQKSTPKKLIRQSTTGTMDSPAKKKEKNRFSALGGFFGKPSPAKTPLQQQPQATRELSHGERQPIESPQPEPQQQRTPSKYQTPDKAQVRAESQSRRGVLSKLSASVALPQEKEKDKSRRPSAAGLLNGFMGRKSYQKDRGSDDSRSQGSQPQLGPQPLLSQTYTDLQEPEPPNQRQRQDSPFQRRQSQEQQYHPQQQVQSRSQPREIPFQDPSLIDQDRGRRVSREPQYDSVPIPGGYSLVRGQGAMAVPTEYDPRGLSRLQQLQSQQQVDPRYIQPQAQLYVPNQGSRLSYQSANLSPRGQGQQAYSAQYTEQPHQQQALSQPQPQLGALETYRDYTNSNNRISREDILARSPPKPLHDQQRPYQISLPGGEIEDDEDVVSTPSRSQHANLSPNPTVSTSTSGRRPQHDSIVRLQQPVIRHPESPAGYPLPEDTVFSPVNPTAVDFPPPPPPKWPSHLDANPQAQVQYQNQQQRQSHDRHVSLSASDLDIDGDLDRSNTRRTAVSAISGISVPRPRSGGSQNGAVGGGGGLNVPTQEEAGSRGGVSVGGRGVSPSPTPPSPMDGDEVRRTDVQIPPRASMEDLYNASPRLPRSGSGFAESESRFNEYGNSNGHADANGRPSGKENSRLDIPREVSRERQYQGNGNGNGGAKHPEEKIYYDSAYRGQARGVGQDGPAELEDHETSMSATSYPGQEWNPYAMGAWDDGVDDVGPSFR